MFDIGWTEMLVIGVVAIIFVGPRELPGMLRTAGQMVRKVRGIAGDFQRQMDDALREAELDGLKDSVNEVRKLNPTTALKDSLNPLKADLEKTQSDIAEAGQVKAAGAAKPLTDTKAASKASAPSPAPSAEDAAVVPPNLGGAVKKSAAKKPVAKKSAAKKPAVKKTAAKKASAAQDKTVTGGAARKAAPKTRKPSTSTKAATSSKATPRKPATKAAS